MNIIWSALLNCNQFSPYLFRSRQNRHRFLASNQKYRKLGYRVFKTKFEESMPQNDTILKISLWNFWRKNETCFVVYMVWRIVSSMYVWFIFWQSSSCFKSLRCGMFVFCLFLFPQNERKICKLSQLRLSQFVYFFEHRAIYVYFYKILSFVNIDGSVLKKYTNLDKPSCLSLYIFLSFWGNESRQIPNIPHLSCQITVENLKNLPMLTVIWCSEMRLLIMDHRVSMEPT
jgi:hypothetical protein